MNSHEKRLIVFMNHKESSLLYLQTFPHGTDLFVIKREKQASPGIGSTSKCCLPSYLCPGATDMITQITRKGPDQ